MDRDPEAVLSAALRARAGGRPGTARCAPRGGAGIGWALVLVAVLGLLAGAVVAGITVVYPLG